MSEIFDLHIDSIAAGGDGVGRHNGLVVFVPRTAPGDLARVRATRRDRLMRGQLLELIRSAPQRVEPPCGHYVIDRCGGCQIQHLLYEAQLEAKGGIIRDSLTRIGRLQTGVPTVEPSDKPWRYRRKLTLALRHRGDQWIAGLHRYDAPDEVFALKDCPITEERVLSAWSLVLGMGQLLPRAKQLRGAVRLLDSGFSFTLEGGRSWSAHTDLFEEIPTLRELWWKPEGTPRRLLHARGLEDQAGASFTQVNEGVAARLRGWVVSLATAMRPKTAVDAYAGTGDIALALARQGIRITAIEIDRDAARMAMSRLPGESRVIAAPVEEALPEALPADIVILNPPRDGVDRRVAETLNAQRPKLRGIIYVSCDPATLARDIGRMEGYRVHSLRGFDMFPQTAHVETVAELVPAA
ncbi:MAG: hypothetical protein WD825_15095 [Gemmatimonadaceae bacterium]